MLLTPNQFLRLGGALLLLASILGFTSLVSQLSGTAGWVSLIFAFVAIIASLTLSAGAQKTTSLIAGALGLLMAAYEFTATNYALIALSGIIGIWGLAAALKKPRQVSVSL